LIPRDADGLRSPIASCTPRRRASRAQAHEPLRWRRCTRELPAPAGAGTIRTLDPVTQGKPMKYVRILLLLVAAMASGSACAQDSAAVEAGKLLDSMNMKATFDQAIALSLDAQLKANPKLVPYKAVMLAFFAKYSSYEALKPAMVEIYAAEFSAPELKQLREFYSTPVGRKAIERMPVMMAKGAEMGSKAVQEHMEELQEMVEAETKRLQDLDRAGSQQVKDTAPSAPEATRDPADGATKP
jgi:hypothetical protein